MNSINISDITRYVEKNIKSFHQKRLQSLEELKLIKILKRKNPYLYRAKNVLTAHDLVKNLLDAHLSSQEEAIFGEFLEGLAIFVNEKVYGGKKSSAEGIDLEFEKDSKHFIISIKSGPNWGNSQQIKKLRDNFKKAARILRTSDSGIIVVAINGCCYGKDNKPDKGDYHKYCGQRFWEFISNNADLYTDIIKPIGNKAKKRNDKFNKEYSKVINKFTLEFSKIYCDENGSLLWKELLKFNSGK
ncbi:MAG: PmeII family type II restriction endonuclease [bacterium]